jgi:hypothetical protein
MFDPHSTALAPVAAPIMRTRSAQSARRSPVVARSRNSVTLARVASVFAPLFFTTFALVVALVLALGLGLGLGLAFDALWTLLLTCRPLPLSHERSAGRGATYVHVTVFAPCANAFAARRRIDRNRRSASAAHTCLRIVWIAARGASRPKRRKPKRR